MILNETVNFPLCLAPMVGLSHVALRQLVRGYLPADAETIWPTEMLNSRKVPHEDLALTFETLRAANEKNLVPQILGNEEKPIRESVLKLREWGASGIDINMGCPVQKALRHNYGVALMGDPGYAAEVVAMAAAVSELPVSVKLRAAGTDGNKKFLLDFVRGLQKGGAAWICLHPRTAEQKRRGSADWEQIRYLKDSLSLPIIGNGDIQTAADVHEMRAQTNCDMVMAGRALAARPWLLWQVGEDLGFKPPLGRESQKAPRTPEQEGAAYGECLVKMIDYCESYFGEDAGLRRVRFWVRTTSCWLMFGQSVIQVSAKSKSLQEMRTHAIDLFQNVMPMSPKTQLRQ